MRQPRSSTLIALALAAMVMPFAAVAQEPAAERPATHTVRRGDTLWDLAQQYLGDPFQWPQIYQINTAIIKDPHWIYPGQELQIPGGTAAATGVAGQTGTPYAAPTGNQATTVFNPAANRTETRSRESLLMLAARTAVRPGEYEASPFMWAEGGPGTGGTINATAETNAVQATMRPLQLRELVDVTLPRGVAAAEGVKLLSYRLGPVLGGQGQVVIPTGVVEVVSATVDGRAKATILRKYEGVYAGHALMVLDTLDMPIGVFPTRVEFGASTRVVWVQSTPRLPSLGHKLIFAAGTALGLRPGDQLSIRVPPAPGAVAVGGDLEVAVAQVTRVTPWGASATLLEVRDGGLTAGLRAQVSAKMP